MGGGEGRNWGGAESARQRGGRLGGALGGRGGGSGRGEGRGSGEPGRKGEDMVGGVGSVVGGEGEGRIGPPFIRAAARGEGKPGEAEAEDDGLKGSRGGVVVTPPAEVEVEGGCAGAATSPSTGFLSRRLMTLRLWMRAITGANADGGEGVVVVADADARAGRRGTLRALVFAAVWLAARGWGCWAGRGSASVLLDAAASAAASRRLAVSLPAGLGCRSRSALVPESLSYPACLGLVENRGLRWAVVALRFSSSLSDANGDSSDPDREDEGGNVRRGAAWSAMLRSTRATRSHSSLSPQSMGRGFVVLAGEVTRLGGGGGGVGGGGRRRSRSSTERRERSARLLGGDDGGDWAGAGTETWCGSDTAECSALGVLKSVLVVGGRIACMVVVMVI